MPTLNLTIEEVNLLRTGLAVYRQQVREACAEDQGTPEGRIGTVGHDVQKRLLELEQKMPL